MSAGTITLTNKSAAVTGSGTSFIADLKPNDFVVFTVGQTTYTMAVKNMVSDTELTLVKSFTGPTTSGLVWTAMPVATMVLITSEIVVQSTEALRAQNYDRYNWEQVYSQSTNITVTLSDGSTFTGPSWNSISATLTAKADKTALEAKADKAELDSYAKKGANSDITSLSGLTTALSIAQGGTGGNNQATARAGIGLGSAATANIGTSGATVPLLNGTNTFSANQVFNAAGSVTFGGGTTENQNGSSYWSKTYTSFRLSTLHASPVTNFYAFEDVGVRSGFNIEVTYGSALRNNYLFLDNGTALATNWSNTSDGSLKGNITQIENALAATISMRGVVWDWNKKGQEGQRGIGVIAQEAEAWYPEAVTYTGKSERLDGELVDNAMSLNTGGLAAALHTEAIRALFDMVKKLANGEAEDVKTQIVNIESMIKPFYKNGDEQGFTPPAPIDRNEIPARSSS